MGLMALLQGGGDSTCPSAVLSPVAFFSWAHYGTKVWVDWKKQEPQGKFLLSVPLKTLS